MQTSFNVFNYAMTKSFKRKDLQSKQQSFCTRQTSNKKTLVSQEKIIIVDSHSVVYRAYYGVPELTNSKGEAVNAIYGFFSFFLKSIKVFQPRFVVIAFDSSGPTFRHKEYLDYKAKRKKIPSGLKEQIIYLKQILESINISIFEKQGFEGDDIIGTIKKKIDQQKEISGLETIILSADLDLLQLITKQTKICMLNRGTSNFIIYGTEKVKERYCGIRPEQLIDMKGLKGDSSDNIPGVPGIGEKTAVKLINDFQNLDNLYQELDQETEKSKLIKPAIKKKLLEFRDQAFFSKKLCEIKYDVPIEFNLKDCQWNQQENKEKMIMAMKELEFYSLIKRL